MRSKLYPVERKVGCRGCGSSRCQFGKSISITEESSKPPIILEVDGIIIRVMSEKLRVVTGKM